MTNIDNSGPGSLRQAIKDANDAAGADVIAFSIPGNGTHFISPRLTDPNDSLSAAMPITGPVTLDGYTQPGASPATSAAIDDAVITVQLDGGLAPGGLAGVFISGSGVTVRGLSITHFSDGIIIRGGGGGNVIAGNFIGVSADTNPLGNTGRGVSIENSPNNTVGGTSPADRNLISANGGVGVRFVSSGSFGNSVLGNFIGTDWTGLADMGNGGNGIEVGVFDTSQGYASQTTIGGTSAAARNVISGNGGNGIALVGTPANSNVIRGNYIGTAKDGVTAIPNDANGIDLTFPFNGVSAVNGSSSNNVIGGTTAGAGNVISGNKMRGILLIGSSDNNVIQGNFIGTNAFGNTAVPNARDGISIQGVETLSVRGPQGNLIGGTAVGAGNVISGNGRDGIQLFSATTTSNVIQHNRIGIAVNNQALGNAGNGIFIDLGASETTIGYDGSAADPVDAANIIAHNGGAGVTMTSGRSNRVSANSIYANTKAGIDLGNDGATANDEGDPDVGANGLLNSPLISDAKIEQNGALHVTGKYASAAGVAVRVEFFRNPQQDHLSIDSGKQFLGSRNLTTGPDGTVAIDTTFGGTQFALGDTVTATATDSDGNTSEFGTGDCDVDLTPLTVTGSFAFNPATGMCEATGTADKPIEIGNAGGSVRVRVVGKVAYNQKTLHATGTFSALFADWQPLFTGSIDADVGSPAAGARLEAAADSTLPEDMRPVLLPEKFTDISFTPFDIMLRGSVTLPVVLPGLSITVGGANYFVVSPQDNRLLLSGAAISLPNVGQKLFNALDVQLTGMVATYVGDTNTLKLQGSLKIKLVGLTLEANFAGPENFISLATFTSGTPPVEQIGGNCHGTLSMSDLKVAEGLFGIKSASLTVGVTNNELTQLVGAAQVQLPSGKEVDGTLGFKVVDGNWQLDELGLTGKDLNVALGTTGIFLQQVGGSVKDLAVGDPAPTFEGTLGFSIGPKITVPIPELFGGPFTGAIAELVITADVTVDVFNFNLDELVLAVSGELTVAGGLEKATASAELNFPERQLKFAATYTALANFVSGSANININPNLDVTGTGTAAIKVPPTILLIGGLTLAGGSGYLQYRNDNTFADDFVSGYVEVGLGPFTTRFGLRVGFDGTVESLTAPLQQPPAAAADSVQALDAAARGSFVVPSSAEPVVLGASWENTTAAAVPFRIIGPGGVVYTNADDGGGKIQVVRQLSTGNRLNVAVLSPQPGTWTLELPQTDGLGAVTIEGAVAQQAPSVTLTDPVGTVAGDQVRLAYRAQAPNPDTTVSLFYDTDGGGFDGKQIVGGLPSDAGQYTWDTTAVAPGDYHVYAIVSDSVGAPAFAYAPGVVHVAPRVMARRVFYNNSAFDGHDPAANAADDGAIDSHKSALLPGRRASFANVTGYTAGINGVMIDLAGLSPAATGALSADDFDFKVGAGGRSGWAAAPAPAAVAVRPGAGLNGSARVTLTWPDRSIRNTWLQVTVKADAHTGLSRPDVFYFGNLVGKTGGPGSPLRLGAQDLLAIRRGLSSVAFYASDTADVNHDGKVNAFDLAATRANLLRVLQPVDTAAALVRV